MKHHGETFSLANGVAIPCLGFGTWQMKEGPETVAAIQKALELATGTLTQRHTIKMREAWARRSGPAACPGRRSL